MKIAIVQMNPVLGDYDANVRLILLEYKKAVDAGCDLVVFPELALSGYPPEDLLLYSSTLEREIKALRTICAEVGDTAMILGTIEKNWSSGKPLYNTAVFIHQGSIISRQNKTLLPTYSEFDERRYFEPGQQGISTVKFKGQLIAMLVCEDIWGTQSGELKGNELYEYDPLGDVENISPDLLVTINASPFTMGKVQERYQLVSNIARRIFCPVIYVNRVGGQDELVFDGSSFIVNEIGECLVSLEFCRYDSYYCDLEIHPVTVFPQSNNIGELLEALILGFKDYARRNGMKRAVLGLSGGIDSAVAAVIAVRALGPKNVQGIGMPMSGISSPDSVTDAEDLARNLGMDLELIPIGSVFDTLGSLLNPFIGWNVPGSVPGDVTEENVQARIRGQIVMAYSNRTGAVPIATGNKSEMSVGYATLYGDMAGGFAVLKDVLKLLVFELADYINREREIIPWNTINKPPSADLAPDQKDSDSLPSYEVLDPVLQMYIEWHMGVNEVVKATNFDREVVLKIIQMVNQAEFKRRQSAPGVKVTAKALGTVSRRWPISTRLVP